MRTEQLDDLLASCGNSSKAMKEAAYELRVIGLESMAVLLERAEQDLRVNTMMQYDDTQPINIVEDSWP